MFNFIFKNIIQDKSKLLLSIGGTAFCVLLMIILQSILTGIIYDAGLYSKKSGADIFIAQSGVNKMLGAASFIENSVEDKLLDIEGIDNLQSIYANKFCFDKDDKKVSAYLIGYDLDNELGSPWKLYDGREVEKLGEIVIDKNISLANDIKINDYIELGGKDFKVVGLSEETNVMANQYMFVLKDDAKKLLLSENAVNYFLAKTNQNVDEIVDKIEESVDEVDAFSSLDFSKNNEKVQKDMIGGPLSIMVVISFGIGVMIVALTTYTSTKSKMKEYTTLKALGVRTSKLNMMIFMQTIINSTIGLVLGVLISFIVSSFINSIGESVSSVIDINNILISIVLALVMSIIASFISSRDINSIDSSSVFK